MEIANQWAMVGADVKGIRIGRRRDVQAITNLLRQTPYAHLHADWHFPVDWLGMPGFVVLEEAEHERVERSLTERLIGSHDRIAACLAVAADPPPAAWVRVSAVKEFVDARVVLAAMFAAVVDYLRQTAVSRLGWLLVESWPESWILGLGFERYNDVETYIKSGTETPLVQKVSGLVIRPVKAEDMKRLEKIESDAFDPLWRHSVTGLTLARRHAFSFDVAELDGRIVGFQFSTLIRNGAHLVRMTVDPTVQGSGVGSIILAHALHEYRNRGIDTITLNTQADNHASQRLYQRFGFRPNGQRFPVWAVEL